MSTQNGSFLFLNAGSNTIGFSNAFTFSNPNTNQNANLASYLNPLNPPVRTFITSNPTSRNDIETCNNPETEPSKENSEHDNTQDPEWILEKKSRCTSTGTGMKLKCQRQTTNITTKNKNEQTTLQPKPIPVPAPASSPPPPYLVNFLVFFGWKISVKSETGENVYQSPNGTVYHSLPKAFETFLDGNSKYKEKPWLASSSTSLKKVGTNTLHDSNQEKKPKNSRVVKRSFEKAERSGENEENTSSTKRRRARRKTTTEKKEGSNKEEEKSKPKEKILPKVNNTPETQLNISSSKRSVTPNGKDQEVPLLEQCVKGSRIPSGNGNSHYKESTTVLGLCAKRSRTIYQNGDLQSKEMRRRANTHERRNGSIQFKDSHQARCILTARSKIRTETETKNRKSSDQKLTILSILINSGILIENQRVMYVSTEAGTGSESNFLTGTVTQTGILCSCCDEIVQIQEFESHAGNGTRNPWENIFLVSGQTLVQCLKEAWDKEVRNFREGLSAKGKNVGVYDENDQSDDTCGICADGGRLICCDGCLSTFHQDCLNLKALPEGSWYCPYCRCQFCKEYGSEQHIGCGPVNFLDPITCKQCKRNYHKNCAWRNDNSESNSFCSKGCYKLAQQLSELNGASNRFQGNFSWTLLKITENSGADTKKSISSILERNLKLVLARSVLSECFFPLTDQLTGIDVVSQAIFSKGSCYNRLNYEGFHTVVLQKDDEVISVALLRFHGKKLAEMPFVATRPKYQKQGMCHHIIKGVEQLLVSLEVEKLVVPAVPDMVNTWTKSFSFRPLEPSLQEEVKSMSLIIFAETTLLEKTLFKRDPNKQGNNNVEASQTSPFPLYTTGFPFFSMPETLQHSQLSSQRQNGNIISQEDSRNFTQVNLVDSRSYFAQVPSSCDELPAFNSEVYNNISFESLLRM